ncbi:hypothetical protein WME91_30205 [Sorangium sp. So ce269]
MATGYHEDDDVADEETICQRAGQMDPDTRKKYSDDQFCVSESYAANGFTASG